MGSHLGVTDLIHHWLDGDRTRLRAPQIRSLILWVRVDLWLVTEYTACCYLPPMCVLCWHPSTIWDQCYSISRLQALFVQFELFFSNTHTMGDNCQISKPRLVKAFLSTSSVRYFVELVNHWFRILVACYCEIQLSFSQLDRNPILAKKERRSYLKKED